MNPPKFLDKVPQPRIIQRLYHARKLQVWEGHLKIDSIFGWPDNPRIDLVMKQFRARVGNRDLSQEEVYDLMKNTPEVKLKELRDDILKNGLREPLVVSFAGRLLDGNRRYFAVKYALEGMALSDPRRVEVERVPVFVLMEDASDIDERHVLVEENFAASLKIEWPDYVKAKHVKNDADAGMRPEDIAAKYSWNKSKVRETLRIWEVVDEFLALATSDPDPEDEAGGGFGLSENEAEMIAAENYQFFNEAQKSFFDQLKIDVEFKIQFFRWIKDGKFGSFPEVRIAYKAWNHPEARPILMGPEPTSAKDAKAVLDYNARIVKGGEEVANRIDSFVSFLHGLKAGQIASLPPKSIEQLGEALSLLERLAEAASTSLDTPQETTDA